MSIEDNSQDFSESMTKVFGPTEYRYHPKSFFDASLYQDDDELGETIKRYARAQCHLNESKRLYMKRIRKNPSILPEWLKKEYAEELATETKVAVEKVRVVPFYWVTISCKPGTDVQLLKAKATKAFSKKWITSVRYTFEIGDGGNPHVHALVGFDVSKNLFEARKEFQSTFKTLGVTANNVEVKPLTRLHMKNNLGYMCKNKPSDVTWRAQNFLPAYIQSSNFEERTDQYRQELVDGCLSPLSTDATAAITVDSEGDMWDQGSLTPDPSSP